MSDTIKLNPCPKCGAPIPAAAPQGLCPRCVLLGAATATEAGVPPTATSEIPSQERVAASFPQLEILELIGRGGMGFVFKARQPHLDRFVALKLLPDKLARDPRFAERFNREGRVLARLNHPNIVSVYDFGQTGHFYFLLMEYVDGVNLRQAMKAGRFSPGEALSIVPKICEALQYAHSEGILHRDIKPENILLDTRGQVKIADFGIAKLVGEEKPDVTLTATGAALGTPHYMAPEQLEKPAEVDHRADIYSLGVVFYEMLTGELPIGRFAAPSSKTPVGADVDEVVFRTLEKDRERRFQSAGEMKTQVEHLTESHGAGAPADASGPRPLKESTSHVSTPEHARSFVGRFLYIYQGTGTLRLTTDALFFERGWNSVTIPLRSLRALGIGQYSAWTNLMRLDYLAVTFEEHGRTRTLFFTAVPSAITMHWDANRLTAEWHEAVAAAARKLTGHAVPEPATEMRGAPMPSPLVRAILFVGIGVAGMAAAAGVFFASKGHLPRTGLDWLPVLLAAIPGFATLVWVLWRESSNASPPTKSGRPADASLVARPAQALIATGVFNWLASLVVIGLLSFSEMGRSLPMEPGQLGLIAALFLALSSLIIAGGLKMLRLESHSLGVCGSVVAMITSPGSIVGLPVGIWSLLTLCQPRVRDAFLQHSKAARAHDGVPPKPVPAGDVSWSQKAIWSAVLAAISLPTPIAVSALMYFRIGVGASELTLVALSMCFPGIIGSILGWTALSDIRLAHGRMRGLRLAVFGAMTLPLILLAGAGLVVFWMFLGLRAGAGSRVLMAGLMLLLIPAGMIGFGRWGVRAASRWGANLPASRQRGVLKWVFLGFLLAAGGFALVLNSTNRTAPNVVEALTELAATDTHTNETPWIRFTFTAVELREQAGTRWLAMDYVDDVHGNCQKAFPWQATIPGFKAETRTSEHFIDDKGSPSVRHQRIEYRLPDESPREQLEKLRENLVTALHYKSVRLELGEAQVPLMLFELPGVQGGSLKAWLKVIPPLGIPSAEDEAAEIRIRMAQENLNLARQRLAAGVVAREEVVKAEVQLEIAEAQRRGDAVAVAQANLKLAEYLAGLARQHFERGLVPSSEFQRMENELALAKAELKAAQQRAPKVRP